MNAKRTIIQAGILFSVLGVALGAFGAHALYDVLERNDRIDTYELAVRYQFYHSFAIIISGVLYRMKVIKYFIYAAVCFGLGIIFFSGSLYILSLTGVRGFGAITPAGGILFIAGWVLLLAGAGRTGRSATERI